MNDLTPQPEVRVSWDDPILIKSTIVKMKPYKAPGVDGWRAQELKLVPWPAIIHLSEIFRAIWGKAFGVHQMLARTVLLAKTLQPATFSDGRPFAILGCIPRLTSKMVADQLLNFWGERWDPKIAGGLPFRAVKDVPVQQQYLIEQAHKTNSHYGGFALDLVKLCLHGWRRHVCRGCTGHRASEERVTSQVAVQETTRKHQQNKHPTNQNKNQPTPQRRNLVCSSSGLFFARVETPCVQRMHRSSCARWIELLARMQEPRKKQTKQTQHKQTKTTTAKQPGRM